MEAPAKLYYSISEVSKQTGVKAYVLRYWESQFSMLRPRKSRGGVRKYRPKDLALVETIRHLLYDRGFTIAGARRKILDERKEIRAESSGVTQSERAETAPLIKTALGKSTTESNESSTVSDLSQATQPSLSESPVGPGADSFSVAVRENDETVGAVKVSPFPKAELREIRQELVQLRKLLAKNRAVREINPN